MEIDYWEKFYSHNDGTLIESPFANFILENYIDKNQKHFLLELGCGNGRDCLYFHKESSLDLLGIDQCKTEIKKLNTQHSNSRLKFDAMDFTNLPLFEHQVHYLYSRFTLHAVDDASQSRLLQWATNNIASNGLFFIECRSIKDDLYNVGEKVGPHAFVTTHYRRFIDHEMMQKELTDLGFEIVFALESRDLAVYKDENPVVTRIIARKH